MGAEFFPIRVSDGLRSAEPLITLPVMLVALLRYADLNVGIFRSRGGEPSWTFRFAPTAMLLVADDGTWRWVRAPERWRKQVEPLVRRAEAMLAVAYAARGG